MKSVQTSAGKRPRSTLRFAHKLLEITNEVARARTLDDALVSLVDITITTIGAERGTIFLHDRQTHELYSRVAHVSEGHSQREIRILDNTGVAGWVYTNEKSIIIDDAYAHELFNDMIDKRTGFKTQNILCALLRNLNGDKIGVAQILNKKVGEFGKDDLFLLEAMTEQASIALQSNLVVEQIEETRRQESQFLDVVSSVSSEINIGPLLSKIISAITMMLDAERSTLFINDEKTNELYTEVGEGLGVTGIRLPNHVGIVGNVFTSAKTINIPHAYADLRFNPSFDRQTGFFTRSILCMPVFNKMGKVIGVTQALNKRGGPFTKEDEERLSAFTSQISIGIENAKLFDDVQTIKNYNESMLESMSNAVITTDTDGKIVTCNKAGERITRLSRTAVVGQRVTEFFTGKNEWLADKINTVFESKEDMVFYDAELEFGDEIRSCNVSVLPLANVKQKNLGSMLMMEDISNEKRMKSTMSRYMDPKLADQLMEGGQDILGGLSSVSTVLFSDIRSFTTLTEELGPQGTVSFLNEYFTIMVDCLDREGGLLDKFIGDAIMAIFGAPIAHDDDADRGIRAAIAMMTELVRFNERRINDGKRPVDHGMGLNTDNIVSGNIGSPKRMNYTAIGDGVNLAARLESSCKQYGAHIVISEYTLKAAKGTYRTREIDKVIVKGKTEPVGVYEVLDYHNDDSFPHHREVVGHFANGLTRYKQAQWDKAIGDFEEALKLNPKEKCSSMYIDRCKQLMAKPPAGDWHGVWIMTTK